jgi:hypothetical protein
VIWATVLEKLEVRRSEIFFVSKNTKDFADPSNDHRLHRDLLEDLKSVQTEYSTVKYFPGLEELLASAIAPRQKILPEIKTQLETGQLGGRDLREWLTDILPSALNRARDEWFFQFPRHRQQEWAIGRMHDIKNAQMSSTSSLTDRSILVILFVQFLADLVPRQLELGLDITSDYGIINPTMFVGFIGVEVELGTQNILQFHVDRLAVLEEKTKVQGIQRPSSRRGLTSA